MPLKHLSKIAKSYPEAWRMADEIRTKRGKDRPDWPAWCFLPLSGWHAVVSAHHRLDRLTMELTDDIPILGALGAWRPTQGVYRFDPELYDALASTSLEGDLPCEVLYRLPAWCVYVETPLLSVGDCALSGFFAHLDYNINHDVNELWILFIGSSGELAPVMLRIGQWSLAEGLSRMFEVAKRSQQKYASELDEVLEESTAAALSQRDTLRVCINLLLYLCSTEPDARGPAGTSYSPGYPQAKKVKTGWRLFPPDAPTIWRMGETVGEAIRSARSAPRGGTHASPRPHIRRAHWHGFWSGTIKTREGVEPKPRKFDVKWIPPIAVAMGDDEET